MPKSNLLLAIDKTLNVDIDYLLGRINDVDIQADDKENCSMIFYEIKRDFRYALIGVKNKFEREDRYIKVLKLYFENVSNAGF